MRRAPIPLLITLVFTLLALPAGARAEDEPGEAMGAPARTMLLGAARVLASPGTPGVLHEVLPGRGEPARLTWPLPDDPVVVLGLPHHDEVAQQVADAFQIDTDDLDGGYRIVAWRDGRRPMVVIMAADASALAAARFEFDAAASMAMAAPDMRSLDFKKPNQEAGVAVERGVRVVRPRYAYRAWAPLAWGDPRRMTPELITQAAGAQVNRLWFRVRDLPAGFGRRNPKTDDLLARTRRHGIVPVLWLSMGDATVAMDPMHRARYIATMSELALGKLGLRHVVLEFEADPRELPRRAEDRATCEAQLLETLALEFGRAREIVVIPSAETRTGEGRPFGAADLATLRIEPAVRARMRMGWSGPQLHATSIQSSQARTRKSEAGLPLILLDRWAEPFQDVRVPYVPSLPRARDDALEHVLDGVTVFGHRGTEAMLESLWAPIDGPSPMAELDALCPPWPKLDGAAWAAAFATRVREADKDNLGLLPWLAPVATHAERAARRDAPCWVLPRWGGRRVHQAAYLEAAKRAFAAELPEGVLVGAGVLGDGGLSFLIQADPAAWEKVEPLLRIRVRDPRTQRELRAEWTPKRWHVEGSLHLGIRAEGHAQATTAHLEGRDLGMLRLDRFALGGDLHAGRVLEVGIAWGPKALWPPEGGLGAMAPWIVGPVSGVPQPPAKPER